MPQGHSACIGISQLHCTRDLGLCCGNHRQVILDVETVQESRPRAQGLPDLNGAGPTATERII